MINWRLVTFSMYSYISAMVYSAMPLMVNVFPLLVCPYAKILAVVYMVSQVQNDY